MTPIFRLLGLLDRLLPCHDTDQPVGDFTVPYVSGYPYSVPSWCKFIETSPAAGSGVGAPLPAPTPDTMHQKSEGCWCGDSLSCEGSETAVLDACSDFRRLHRHRRPTN